MRIVNMAVKVAIGLVVGWLLCVQLIKLLPRESPVRQAVTEVFDEVVTIFGGKPIKQANSVEQENNLDACFTFDEKKLPEPPQCSALWTCLQKSSQLMNEHQIAYSGVPRPLMLSEVSLGWEMQLVFFGPENGSNQADARGAFKCLAKGKEIIKLTPISFDDIGT